MYLWFYLLHRTVWQLVFSHSGNGARLSHNHVNTNLNWVDLPYGNLWHCMYESWATDCWQCWLRNWNQNCWPAHGLMHVRLEGCQYSHSIQLNTKKVQSPADKATTSTANSWPSFAVLSMMCLVASKTSPHASNYRAQQRVKRLRSHCVKIRGLAPETCMEVQLYSWDSSWDSSWYVIENWPLQGLRLAQV